MHDRVSVNSICFMHNDFEEQAGFWRELGAGRVSLVGPHIDALGIDAAEAALATGDYALETIVHPFLPGQTLELEAAAWDQPRQHLLGRIATAQRLGAQSIYMTTGGRGRLTWEDAAEVFCELVAPCVAEANNAGIALLIENAPPVYADLHIAHTLRDTVALAEMAGIGVCIDLFGCWTEAGLEAMIRRAVPNCRLVQISDYVCGDRSLPGRAAMGDGDMPHERLFRWLLEAGYAGAFDIELLGPRIDEQGALLATDRTARFMTDMLHKLDG